MKYIDFYYHHYHYICPGDLKDFENEFPAEDIKEDDTINLDHTKMSVWLGLLFNYFPRSVVPQTSFLKQGKGSVKNNYVRI